MDEQITETMIPEHDPYSDFLACKHIADGRFVGIIPLTFGRARLVIGTPPPWGYDDVW